VWRHLLIALLIGCSGFAAAPSGVAAQETPDQKRLQTPVLTVRSEQVFLRSAYGQRIESDYKSVLDVVATENRRIEAELTAEEQDLTRKRDTMEHAEFSALAQEFDTKVREIRRERDMALAGANQTYEASRAQFWEDVRPVMVSVLADSGAAVMVERQSVIASADAIDVTDDVVARIDEVLGEGPELRPEMPSILQEGTPEITDPDKP
tara:strand:- start:1349 stop:1972 length:624 start_codon:yes stop_codon:yes gene_type:complete